MSRAEAAVRCADVRFAFSGGAFALAVAALEVPAGETLAIVGPSGSGKTTLLDLVAGIRSPQHGTIVTDGFAWERHDPRARRRRRLESIGMVFQEFELLGHLTVRENVLVAYHLDAGLRADRAAPARAVELARAAGIEHLLDRKPARLSQGERQRVALCRALVTRPSLVLADEPTGSLDAASAGGVADLLTASARERGATLIVVTHDADLLDRFDRVLDVRELAGAAA